MKAKAKGFSVLSLAENSKTLYVHADICKFVFAHEKRAQKQHNILLHENILEYNTDDTRHNPNFSKQ
jgi:hypothetical protein